MTKLDPTGSHLLFSTLLGGPAPDLGFISFFDEKGNVYVEGDTSSPTFPTTRGAFQRTFAGGETDAWVAKLNPRGSALDFATYLGGTGEEDVLDLTVDRFGNAYVPGPTTSTDFR